MATVKEKKDKNKDGDSPITVGGGGGDVRETLIPMRARLNSIAIPIPQLRL